MTQLDSEDLEHIDLNRRSHRLAIVLLILAVVTGGIVERQLEKLGFPAHQTFLITIAVASLVAGVGYFISYPPWMVAATTTGAATIGALLGFVVSLFWSICAVLEANAWQRDDFVLAGCVIVGITITWATSSYLVRRFTFASQHNRDGQEAYSRDDNVDDGLEV